MCSMTLNTVKSGDPFLIGKMLAFLESSELTRMTGAAGGHNLNGCEFTNEPACVGSFFVCAGTVPAVAPAAAYTGQRVNAWTVELNFVAYVLMTGNTATCVRGSLSRFRQRVGKRKERAAAK